MTDDSNIRGGLLKANGVKDRRYRSRGTLPEEDEEALRRILERDEARARRMKWVTALAWILFLVGVAAAALIGRYVELVRETDPTGNPVSAAFLIGRCVELAGIVLFYLALLCTLSYGLRAWWARGTRLHSHILSVDVRLARIEDLLEKHLSGSPGNEEKRPLH